MTVAASAESLDAIESAQEERQSSDGHDWSIEKGRQPLTGCDWLRAGGTGLLFCCSVMGWLVIMAVVATFVFVTGRSSDKVQKLIFY